MATYLIINLLVTAGVLVGTRRLPSKRQWVALIGLLALTAIFDNVIVGLGIVGYDHAKILGIYVGRAPIEDFFYPLIAGIIVPTLWRKGGHE